MSRAATVRPAAPPPTAPASSATSIKPGNGAPAGLRRLFSLTRQLGATVLVVVKAAGLAPHRAGTAVCRMDSGARGCLVRWGKGCLVRWGMWCLVRWGMGCLVRWGMVPVAPEPSSPGALASQVGVAGRLHGLGHRFVAHSCLLSCRSSQSVPTVSLLWVCCEVAEQQGCSIAEDPIGPV